MPWPGRDLTFQLPSGTSPDRGTMVVKVPGTGPGTYQPGRGLSGSTSPVESRRARYSHGLTSPRAFGRRSSPVPSILLSTAAYRDRVNGHAIRKLVYLELIPSGPNRRTAGPGDRSWKRSIQVHRPSSQDQLPKLPTGQAAIHQRSRSSALQPRGAAAIRARDVRLNECGLDMRLIQDVSHRTS